MPAWAKALYAASCLMTDRVVAVCEAVAQVLRRQLPLSRRKTVVVHNGIDSEALLSIEPRRPDGQFVFGTMSRLVPVKDHFSLLEAFAAVRSRYSRCRLEILGSGELENELKSFACRVGVSGAVSFLGWSSDVAGFLARLDTFVLSSLSEGLPLTVLEAMAAGLPIVATAVGGITEIVRGTDCGWLCPPAEPALLAERMTSALEAGDRPTRGERGRSAIRSQYSLATMTDRYEELFDGLVNGGRGSAGVRTKW
jgi:glycosyltransferase involved in cell wall biosynthesis